MALSDEAKKAMVATTHETALAMVDDLQHMREIIAKSDMTPGDIRRLSNPLRRMLIDNNGDLRKLYPVHPRSRKSLGEIIRKLSVTESHISAHRLGTSSRRKTRVASANSPRVW